MAGYKETQKTVKAYGEEKIKDWNVNYSYETVDGAKPVNVKVMGNIEGGAFINGDYTPGNKGISFGGGAEFDLDVVTAIIKTCKALTA